MFIIIFLCLFIIFILSLHISKAKEIIACNIGLNSGFNTIILDAGHGGSDGGAVAADGTLEKKINLEITLKLKDLLELYGYRVILTRTDDNSIHNSQAKTLRQQKVSDIKNRFEIINSNQDAIFVSIHQNKYEDSDVCGAQIFYSGNNESSSLLAHCINMSIITHIQPDNHRIIKKSGTEIYLLYHSPIPSVMIECGFLSNSNDLNKLKNDDFQKRLSLAILEGIINYSKG